MSLSAEQAKELADELSALCKQQSRALQRAAYANMSEEQAEEYDKRRLSIGKLCELLAEFKPK
jgi:hypothetical protein